MLDGCHENMPLKDYERSKLIGSGSFGEVHLCRNKNDKQQYVMKKMVVGDMKRRKSAESEAKLLCLLNHPNIVLYKDSFAQDNIVYLIMEYCKGGDMANRMDRQQNKRFPEDKLIEWVYELCLALQYIHSKQIIHRDLKPHNIFLTEADAVKVGDFGISRQLDPGALATTIAGTPLYLSPEVALKQPYDNKTDIWSLGCCVYEMMTFTPAIDASKLVTQGMRVVGAMPTEYCHELISITRRMLTVEAKKRPDVEDILKSECFRPKIKRGLVSDVNKNGIGKVKLKSQPSGVQCEPALAVNRPARRDLSATIVEESKPDGRQTHSGKDSHGRWEYLEDGNFREYPNEINGVIENAYHQNKDSVRWEEVDDAIYQIYFATRTEEIVGDPYSAIKVRRIPSDIAEEGLTSTLVASDDSNTSQGQWQYMEHDQFVSYPEDINAVIEKAFSSSQKYAEWLEYDDHKYRITFSTNEEEIVGNLKKSKVKVRRLTGCAKHSSSTGHKAKMDLALEADLSSTLVATVCENSTSNTLSLQACWEFLVNGDYQPYPDDVNTVIERAYNDRLSHIEWEEANDVIYRLTFSTMEECILKVPDKVKVRRNSSDMSSAGQPGTSPSSRSNWSKKLRVAFGFGSLGHDSMDKSPTDMSGNRLIWEYWDTSDGKFVSYSDITNRIIETAYADSKPYAEWKELNLVYRLMFSSMTEEIVVDPHRTVRVRRRCTVSR